MKKYTIYCIGHTFEFFGKYLGYFEKDGLYLYQDQYGKAYEFFKKNMILVISD